MQRVMKSGSSWEFTIKLVILMVATTLTLASHDWEEANAVCLSEERYKNISYNITEDTLVEMRKEFSDLKGTMKEELESMKKQQDQLMVLVLSLSQTIELLTNRTSFLFTDKSGTNSPIEAGMPITEKTTILRDASTISSSNSPISYDVPTAENENLRKELFNAARDGDLLSVEDLLSRLRHSGLDFNWRNPSHYPIGGLSALHIATEKDYPRIVATLLDSGADPDVQGQYAGLTPMHIAAGLSPMHLATGDNRISVLRQLLRFKADVNLQTKKGWTPVYAAAHFGHTGALELLLAHGGDPNKRNYYTVSPLHTASANGHVEAVRMLIQAGAHIDYADPIYGDTALHVAVEKNQPDVARLLLQNGADKTILDNDGNTPTDWSRKWGDGSESVAQMIYNY